MKSMSAAILVLAGCLLISNSDFPFTFQNRFETVSRTGLREIGLAICVIGLIGWVKAFWYDKSEKSN